MQQQHSSPNQAPAHLRQPLTPASAPAAPPPPAVLYTCRPRQQGPRGLADFERATRQRLQLAPDQTYADCYVPDQPLTHRRHWPAVEELLRHGTVAHLVVPVLEEIAYSCTQQRTVYRWVVALGATVHRLGPGRPVFSDEDLGGDALDVLVDLEAAREVTAGRQADAQELKELSAALRRHLQRLLPDADRRWRALAKAGPGSVYYRMRQAVRVGERALAAESFIDRRAGVLRLAQATHGLLPPELIRGWQDPWK
ncbi:hypothetical protein ACFU99_02780 [Streptomyces sp. NPDC057654]|uniref:hypothetical protein n=1 Tax=Streptomyces sp. NPDC057654 TaxID=3346196 RepID=UPI0036B23B99